MKRPAKQVMPELQKIRHFVMNIIYQSEGKKVKLPSLRTLSAEFGLGASTIKQEFDRLEREGYLVSRHGVGVFTNPKQYFFPETKLPLVGIKLYQGDAYFYDATLMKMIAELMSALSAFPCNVHMLTAGCTTVEELDVELRHSHIDALVTVSVEPELTAFAASRMPAVNIGYPCPETDSVVFRGEAAGRELAELLCGARRSPPGAPAQRLAQHRRLPAGAGKRRDVSAAPGAPVPSRRESSNRCCATTTMTASSPTRKTLHSFTNSSTAIVRTPFLGWSPSTTASTRISPTASIWPCRGRRPPGWPPPGWRSFSDAGKPDRRSNGFWNISYAATIAKAERKNSWEENSR